MSRKKHDIPIADALLAAKKQEMFGPKMMIMPLIIIKFQGQKKKFLSWMTPLRGKEINEDTKRIANNSNCTTVMKKDIVEEKKTLLSTRLGYFRSVGCRALLMSQKSQNVSLLNCLAEHSNSSLTSYRERVSPLRSSAMASVCCVL